MNRKGEERHNRVLQPSVKDGDGSVMVWGCILDSGVGDLFKIDRIINIEMYCQTLIYHARASRMS